MCVQTVIIAILNIKICVVLSGVVLREEKLVNISC
jgi:hypothetical protein